MSETATTNPGPSVSGLAPSAMGITPPSNPDRQGAFLTDVIAELGFADQGAVEEAVNATRQSAKTPERYLLENGVIDERQLSLAVAERNCLNHVDLDQFEVDLEVTSLIDKSTAIRYAALPIAFASDGALLLAIEDPFNMLGINDIEVMTRNEVRPLIATGTQIQSLIETLPVQERPTVTELPELPATTTEPHGEPEPRSTTTLHPQPPPELAAPPEPAPEQIAEPPPSEAATQGGHDSRVAMLPAGNLDEAVDKPNPMPEGTGPTNSNDEEGELAELSTALSAMHEQMRNVGRLVETVERRIGELHDVDDRAEQAATTLADQREEFERERERSVEREQQLESELKAARGELHDVDDRAEQAATTLADQREEFERERERTVEREQQLESELKAARGELHDVDDRAEQAATTLADQREEFERERERSVEREQQLESELKAAGEKIDALKERLSKVPVAAQLASSATEKLAELQGVLKDEQVASP